MRPALPPALDARPGGPVSIPGLAPILPVCCPPHQHSQAAARFRLRCATYGMLFPGSILYGHSSSPSVAMSATARRASRRLVRSTAVGIAVSLASIHPAAAQTDVRRGVSLTGTLVYAGASADGNEAAMRAAGFGDSRPGGCGWGICTGPTAYPQSSADRLVASLSARYRYSNALSVELQTIALPWRVTEGYRHNPTTGFGTFSSFDRSGRAYVATVARHWKTAWFGAGPALVTSKWVIDSHIREKRNSIGVALDAGIVFARRSRLAPMLRAQYRAGDGGSVTSARSGVRARGPNAEYHMGLGFGFAL